MEDYNDKILELIKKLEKLVEKVDELIIVQIATRDKKEIINKNKRKS